MPRKYSQEFRNHAVGLVLDRSLHAAGIRQIVEDA